jgi:hypothetical protein
MIHRISKMMCCDRGKISFFDREGGINIFFRSKYIPLKEE